MGDDKDNREGIGFSGISSLLSDDPPDARTQQHAAAAQPDSSQSTAVPPASDTAGSAPSKPPASSRSTQPAPRPRGGGGAVWVWIGGIALVVILIWAANQSGTQPGGQSTSPPSIAQPDAAQPSTQEFSGQESGPSATAAQSGVPNLQTPPISSGNVFTVAEISYCLALKQQVDGAQPIVDTYDQGQVDRFNAMVDDYNGRCHNFLYHKGDLEQAERDMAPFSNQFQAYGRQVVQGGPANSSNASRSNSDAVPRQTILYVQRTLDALGYNAGVADGIMGGSTQTAIKQFQKEKYLPSDGLITSSLLDHLRAAEILLVHPQSDLPSPTRSPTTAPIRKSDVPASKAALQAHLIHARMIGSCSPTYPTEAARSGQVGTTVLKVRVGTDGGVTSVYVASSSGSMSLDSAAVAAMEQCRFIPANQNGKQVVDELQVPVSFNYDRQTVRSGTW